MEHLWERRTWLTPILWRLPASNPETCLAQHAWEWSNGVLTDLGVLEGGYSSYTNAINSHRMIVGQSQDGRLDPLTGTPAVYLATAWDHGKAIKLGTLGGGNSIAIAVTESNFVMGAAENGLIDTSGMPGFDGVSQIRAFGWGGGDIFDLGTLGGEDAFPGDMNNLGEVVGASTTILFPNSDGIIPVHPFLWSKDKMRDLGTLGGNFCGSGPSTIAVRWWGPAVLRETKLCTLSYGRAERCLTWGRLAAGTQ
jgi:probable HAF family extracellular repeat protein